MSLWGTIVGGLTGQPAKPAAAGPADPAAEPTFDEVVVEWGRYQARERAGEIDPAGEHTDEFVAFYADRVVGYGTDPVELRRRAAAELGVHPERLVVNYLGM